MSDFQGLGAALDPKQLARLGIVLPARPDAADEHAPCCDGSGGSGHRPLVYAWTAPDGREHLRTVPDELGEGFTAWVSSPNGAGGRARARPTPRSRPRRNRSLMSG